MRLDLDLVRRSDRDVLSRLACGFGIVGLARCFAGRSDGDEARADQDDENEMTRFHKVSLKRTKAVRRQTASVSPSGSSEISSETHGVRLERD